MSVLVVGTSSAELLALLPWGVHLASAQRTACVLVAFEAGAPGSERPEELVLDGECDDSLAEQVCAALRQWEAHHPDAGQVRALRLVRLRGRDPLDELLELARDNDADWLVAGHAAPLAGKATRRHRLGQRLLEEADAGVLLVRGSLPQPLRAPRILVATSGAPNAAAALGVAHELAENVGGQVALCTVSTDAGDDAMGASLRRLHQTRLLADLPSTAHVELRPVVAGSVAQGVAAEMARGYDLLLSGRSGHSYLRRWLFGTVPDALLAGPNVPGTAVVRRPRPLAERARVRIGSLLQRVIPQLDRSGRIELFEGLSRGARCGFDFLALMALSTGIAALGLLLNSTAVIIGAMLVAPLMSPMLAAGLALVQGNVPLLLDSSKSVLIGFCVALAVGLLAGVLSPGTELTAELAARGGPNVLDLLVALLSGVAGAYALARPGLSGALAGVAIAAALVPPIATLGICLAIGELSNAAGAATLFGVNLLAIVVGGAACMFAIGVRAAGARGLARRWLRRLVLALAGLMLVVSVPLAARLEVGARPEQVTPELREALERRLGERGATLGELRWLKTPEGPVLEVELDTPELPTPTQADELAALVRAQRGGRIRLRLLSRLVVRGSAEP